MTQVERMIFGAAYASAWDAEQCTVGAPSVPDPVMCVVAACHAVEQFRGARPDLTDSGAYLEMYDEAQGTP